MLVIARKLILAATVAASPVGSTALNPFNNTVLGVVILQSSVPMIVPYFSPPFVYLCTAPS